MNTSDESPNIYIHFIERFLISFPVMTKTPWQLRPPPPPKKNEKLQTAKIIIKLYISEKLEKKKSF